MSCFDSPPFHMTDVCAEWAKKAYQFIQLMSLEILFLTLNYLNQLLKITRHQ